MTKPKEGGERPQRRALTRYLRATGLEAVPEAAPIVEMLRSLADELDSGGGQRPRAEYRQWVKLANQLFDTTPRTKREKPAPPAKEQPEQQKPEVPTPSSKVSVLADFKTKQGITA